MKHLIITSVSLVLGFGWFLGGVPIYSAVDTVFHLYFAREFFEALLESFSWPDWDAFPYDGRGTPAFRFYAPLGYLAAAFWQLLGFSTAMSLKLTVVSFVLIGSVGVWCWFRRISLRNERGWAAGLFLTSPFLAVHLVRVFFFQNVLAVLLLPWVLYGLSRQGAGRRGGSLVAGTTLGIIALTHLPTALMAGYLCVITLLFTRHPRESRAQIVREGLIVFILAGGLSAPYLLPAILEQDSINFQSHMEILKIGKPGDFLDDQRLDDGVASGVTGLLLTGPLAPQLHARFRLFLALVLMASIPFCFRGSTRKAFRFWLSGVCFLPLLIRWSLPIWKILPGLPVLQFSWRWVLPVSIVLLPGTSYAIRDATGNRWLRWLFLPLWLGLLLHVHLGAMPLSPQEEEMAARLTFHYPCEYVPATCSRAACTLTNSLPTEGGVYHRFWGTASMSLLIQDSRRDFVRAEIALATHSVITSQTHFDRHWEIHDVTNNRNVAIWPFGSCGHLQFALPASCRVFVLYRRRGPWRTLGWFCLIVTAWSLVSCCRRRG